MGGHKARTAAEVWKHRAVANMLEGFERRLTQGNKNMGVKGATKQQGEGLAEQLYKAVQEASPLDVKRLLQAAANPMSVAISDGENLVFFAAARAQGACEVCELLVEGRLDPTLVDTRLQQTPLFFAVRAGKHAGGLECAHFLMEQQCSPNHADRRGETLIFYAAQRPEAECSKALLERRANPNHINRFGHTAVFYAARTCAVACLRVLLTARADANACDMSGQTALWEAANTTVMELLLAHQCNVDQTTLPAKQR